METKATTKFEIAEYLHEDSMISEYLNTVLEEGNTDDLITALGHVAKARG
jgi:probable addiction module antidote protein